jgi:two-component system, NtrC family, sensor histidine kinase KinB
VILRTKLLLAQLPLVLALAGTAVAASLIARTLGHSSRHILEDNYRSVLAAQRMKEAVERMDSGALFALSGRAEVGREQVTVNRRRFADELRVQAGNVTEPGERELTDKLRASWDGYVAEFDRFTARPDADAYFDRLLPAFTRVKDAAEAILDINQDAMVRKSEAAGREARSFDTLLLVVAFASCLLAVLASSALTARLLRPLTVLGHVARRIGAGELDARARLEGSDEIATLARELDTMAEHLERYRKSSLGELLEAQQAAQAAMDSMPDPILIVRIDGRLAQVNRGAEEALAVSVEEPGRDSLTALDADVRAVIERVREHVLAGRGAYAPKGLEEAFRVGERWFLPRASPVYSEEGAVSGTTVVLQDVTRLLRFDELKNNLVATVAHEFRTPLTSLRMAIHLMAEHTVGPLTEKQADLVQAAREDCERLQSTVDELLDLSRIQSGRIELRLQPLEIESAVNAALEAHRAMAAQRSVELRAEVLPGTGTVLGDPDRIQLVFANLVNNAVRHSRAGAAVVLRAIAQEAKARFEVVDEGPGIPREYHQAIFEKYFRMPGTPSGGAGLGLFIAKEIVESHGGEIGVISEPGKGSTFWFTVPLAPAAAA